MSDRKTGIRRLVWGAAALAVTLAGIWGILRGITREKIVQKTTVAMGSVVTQTVYAGDAETAQEAVAEAGRAIAALEGRISHVIATSEIAMLNQSTTPQMLSEDTVTLLQTALQVQRATDGLYHVCALPLTALWSPLWDDPEHCNEPPTAEERRIACEQIRATTVAITDHTVTRHGPAGIDLGSVGKGAACDTAVKAYQAQGCSAGLAVVGGSIGMFGTKDDGSPWNIGVRDPNGDTTAQLGTLALTGGFVSTSGTYEKTRTIDEIPYHHLIHPETGDPAETDLVSVTVWCENGALSDILSTAGALLGREAGAALLQKFGAEYVLVDTDNTVWVSEGLKTAFHLTSKAYQLAP